MCERLKRNGADMSISNGQYATPFVGISVEVVLSRNETLQWPIIVLRGTMIAMCNNDGKKKRFIRKAHGHTCRVKPRR